MGLILKPRLRVHVIFSGAEMDDIHRALLGAKMHKPDRIYLITKSKDDKFEDIYNEAKAQILHDGLVQPAELKELTVDYYDIRDIMKTCARIIRDERAQGNDVFFSLASGGKLLSAASTLACMLFDAEVYYVRRDYPDTQLYEQEPIITFPKFHIEPPDRNLITFMHKLNALDPQRSPRSFTKKECLGVCKNLQPGEFMGKSKSESGNYNKMRIKFLDKLERLSYIAIERTTRGRVEITDEGTFGLTLFATFYQIDE